MLISSGKTSATSSDGGRRWVKRPRPRATVNGAGQNPVPSGWLGLRDSAGGACCSCVF